VATAAVLVTIAATLAITRSHWLSDIIAGVYIGLVIGSLAAVRTSRSSH
jgi:hypothetical protein